MRRENGAAPGWRHFRERVRQEATHAKINTVEAFRLTRECSHPWFVTINTLIVFAVAVVLLVNTDTKQPLPGAQPLIVALLLCSLFVAGKFEVGSYRRDITVPATLVPIGAFVPFVSPIELVVSAFVIGLSAIPQRGAAAYKDLSNSASLAMMAAGTAFAYSLVADRPLNEPIVWLYVLVGMTIIDGLSTFNTMVLVYVFAPRHERPNLGLSRLQVARFALLSWVTIVQTGVAITAFVMVDQSLWGLVAVTPLIIMAGRWHQTNQRLNTQRLRDETIQFLLGSTQSAGTTNEAIRQLIDAMIDQSRASFSVIAVESLDQPIVVVKTNEDAVASDEALEDHVALFDCWSATQSVQIVECTTPIESVANYLKHHRLARIMLASSMINDQRCVVCLGYARFDDESFDSIDQTGLATIAGALAAVLRVGSLANSVDELETQHWLMWQQANHDVLTGVANRLRFNDLLNHALLRRTPNLAVIYIDLDNLKTINDTYGHEAGDKLLISAARHLSKCVRQEDTVARLGGDEFAIILDHIAAHDAASLSARLVEGFREIYDSPDGPILATMSAGFAYAEANESASQLVARADKALFQAKQTGRARLVIANS